MKLKIEMHLDNGAFEAASGNPDLASGSEIARILHDLAVVFDGRDVEGCGYPLKDSNGNIIGTAQVTGWRLR